MRRAAVVIAALVLATPAAAALPQEGVVVPGRTFAGLALGATKQRVKAAWGSRFGVCRGCPRTTWYFTYQPFAPQGAGVEFRRGRAVAFFTLWSPANWGTVEGVRTGDPAGRISELYGPLPKSECRGYSGYRIAKRRSITTIYVDNEKVWGFGLSRPGIPICR